MSTRIHVGRVGNGGHRALEGATANATYRHYLLYIPRDTMKNNMATARHAHRKPGEHDKPNHSICTQGSMGMDGSPWKRTTPTTAEKEAHARITEQKADGQGHDHTRGNSGVNV
jgi:hypothetical protein